MKAIRYIVLAFLPLLLFSCEKRWEEHYDNQPETVDMNVWEAVQQNPDLSLFVQYMKEFEYDTLFLTDKPYSLFIPDNNAITALTDTGEMTASILDYHISVFFIQSRNIRGKKKIQTLAEKFAYFENTGSRLYFDEIVIASESPLYRNGKYFVTGEVGLPKPNLYEFFSLSNPVLAAYIDSYDSLVLDKELSRPIGFDEYGNTIYDTVAEVYNEFEEIVFPVSKEDRYKSATFAFPGKEKYNGALDRMAETLGDLYQDHNDIPLDWQYEVLIPYVLEHGVFENFVELDAFIHPPPPDTLKMKNILGDSIYVEYDPVDQELCSNGYAYDYAEFAVPDTLFAAAQRFEGEHLLEQVGANKFAWLQEVKVSSSSTFEPLREFVAGGSNDSILRVPFTLGYDQDFDLEFKVKTLFPRRYLMVVRTHMFVGGIYDIFVNDELVYSIDYYDYVLQRELWYSVTGKRYKPEGAFNRFDCWVENNAPYGECTVKFVYNEPGRVNSNGLVIDYIDFIPYDD